MMDGGMGLWMLLWALIAAAALTLAVVGGGWVVKELTGRSGGPPALRDRPDARQDAERPSALEQAQERYVRGEIDHAEFERLLDNLLRADQHSTDDR
jgi:uncharacterized membrane protein